MLTFKQWMARFNPEINLDFPGARELTQFYGGLYQEYVDGLGGSEDEDILDGDRTGAFTDSFAMASDRALASGALVSGEVGEGDTSFVFQNEEGLWVDPLTGTFHSTQGEALQSFNAETQRLRFQGELDVLQEESQADIERVGAEESARARQLEAQRTGHALRQAQNALLARGRSAGEVEQLTAGGIEGAQRSLAGLLTDINLQTQRTAAQLGQQSIGTALTAEGLAGERSRLGQASTQFQQSLEETRRQFGLGQTLTREQMAQQQAQFASGLGFDQTQLAQAQAQFEAELKQRRKEQGFFGSQGLFGDIIGGIDISF